MGLKSTNTALEEQPPAIEKAPLLKKSSDEVPIQCGYECTVIAKVDENTSPKTGNQMSPNPSSSEAYSPTDDFERRRKGKKFLYEKDPDNVPPHSRLFIVCGKSTTPDELTDAFSKYGNIEYCRSICDKESNTPKGLCYMKFDRASSAALAMEEMDGICLYEHSMPIRVQIADAKGSGRAKKTYTKEPEDTPPRSRLFVVCPKEMTEDAIRDEFSQYDNLEYCKIITDKITGESKGVAFVKFYKASSAALAMEGVLQKCEIDGMKIKVLIADPKVKKTENDLYGHFYADSFGEDMDALHFETGYPPYFQEPNVMFGQSMYPPTQHPHNVVQKRPPPVIKLFVICPIETRREDLVSLFSAYSGYQCVEMVRKRSTGEFLGHAYIHFSNVEEAHRAQAELDQTDMHGKILRVVLPNNSPSGSPKNAPAVFPPMSPPQFMLPYPPFAYHQPVPYYYPPQPFYPQEVGDSRLSFHCSLEFNEKMVYDIFGAFGDIECVQMEASNCGGIVKFIHYQSAINAHMALNGKFIQPNVPLHVSLLFPGQRPVFMIPQKNQYPYTGPEEPLENLQFNLE